MKKLTYILTFLVSTALFSQTIIVDNTTNSPAQLVELLLGNSCVEVSNVSISSPQSVAYFNRNSSSFPINEGIVIRNGLATNTQGVYNNTNLSTKINTNGDTYLQNLSDSSGQSAAITDVAFLEFDFIPLSNTFSFNFLFASNEYGEYQCEFSDVFAFVLTNLNTGIETNLAVIPGTSTPVTVKDIRNSIYNFPGQTCASSNDTFFGVYNVDSPSFSTLNMRGHTIVMNAASAVVPNVPYKIRLVIGDYNDANFDSAVFLAAGSFTTTLDMGPDQIICTGDAFQLNTNLDDTYAYTWFENGNPIPSEISASYIVSQLGTYTVEATKGSCLITDTVVFTNLIVIPPQNLQTCNNGAASYSFNLTINDEVALGLNTTVYTIFYYETAADILASNPILNNSLSAYNSAGAQTILIKIFNTITGNFCDAVYPFDLIVTNTVTATMPAAISICETIGTTNYSINPLLDVEVLNGEPAANYTITYHNSIADASAGFGAITAVAIPNGITSVVIGIRMQDNTNPICFDVTSLTLQINPLLLVDVIPNPTECSTFTLPPLVNGNYFTGPNGTGTPLFAGNVIDLSGIYYIFSGPDANGCTNESFFNLLLIDEYVPLLDHCGVFTTPIPPRNIGNFYTAPGGPSGGGTLYVVGTPFSNTTSATITMTIYYYAEVGGVFCRDDAFVIYIHPLPLLDSPADVTTCDTFVLPTLTNGNYFSGPNGSGVALFAGDLISVAGPNFPEIYYVFNQEAHTNSAGTVANCALENDFQINLVDTTQFTTISGCGNYLLPSIPYGGYYTAPMGGGNQITDFNITSSQTIYYYTSTSVLPNCTDNLNYVININPRPAVDILPSGVFCGEFVLPVITNGTYYTLSGGPLIIGQQQLNAGNIIDLSGTRLPPGTYYIYNGPNVNNCDNETSFTISLNPFPLADGVLSETRCTPYSIPAPINGTIYTAPGGPFGAGVVVSPVNVFEVTTTFYLYNIDAATGCEINRPFTITYSGNNLPDYQNVIVCENDNYQLPVLTHVAPTPFNYTIGYFYDTGGVNPVPAGTLFNTPNSNITIYVYAVNGDRVLCSQEDSFVVAVSETPDLSTLNLVFDSDECEVYMLPTFPVTAYAINYYTQPGGNLADVVTNLNITTPGTYTYYVHAMANGNPNCMDEIPFTFTIHPLLDITLQGGIICVDSQTGTVYSTYTINSGLNPALFTVNWYLNGILMGTGPNYTADQAGVYNVEFTKLTPDLGSNCNYNNTTVTITQSGPAVADFTVSAAFENNTFITVNITGGFGNYLYQLENPNGDLSALQSSNVFSNLATGEYFVNIFDDLANCAPTRLGPIFIINYPNYFTPNDDGINDFWNIPDLSEQPDAVISIFDRYGKFLKQIYPASIGWDGMYNGEKLPSTDYWFTVDYLSQKTQVRTLFKAHFSLKR